MLALFAALVAISKAVFRIPIHVPGHTGITWMAILVVGRALVRRPLAGTTIGLVSGILAIALVGGHEGPLLFLKYTSAGAVMDVAAWLSGDRLTNPYVAILAGAAANLAKLSTSLVVGVVLGIPAGYLALGLGLAATTHLVFGGLGGWLGAFLSRKLEAMQLPALQSLAAEREARG